MIPLKSRFMKNEMDLAKSPIVVSCFLFSRRVNLISNTVSRFSDRALGESLSHH